MTKLLVLDDREAMREGFRLLLQTQPDFEVIADLASPIDAYEALNACDVAMVSQELTGIGGTAVMRELVRRQPRVRAIALAVRCDEDAVREALLAGARGYVLRQQSSMQVFEAIRAVAQGHTYLAPQISHLLVEDHLRMRRGERPQTGPCDKLSPRERDVFDLLVRGYNNQKISRLLGISTKTVETHRAHVLQKLNVHSVVDLIRFAARHQLPLD